MIWKQTLRRRPADAQENPNAIELVTEIPNHGEKPFRCINIISAQRAKQILAEDEFWPSFGIYGKQMERTWKVAEIEPPNWK